MGLREQPEAGEYDAFISYRRTDIDFARRLEKALKAYRPPRGFAGPQRHLRVFRDEGDLTGTDYFKSIDQHLRGASKLIVLCSPAARDSEYVNDEIRRFVAAHGAGDLVPLLLAGVPNNEAGPDLAEQRAFPEALCAALEMPLAANYLDFDPRRERIDRGRYEGSWYTLLANLYDTSRDDIEQRDRVRRRRQRRLVGGLVGGVLSGFALLAAIAWLQKLEADTQRNTALRGLAKYLAAESADVRATQPQTSLLLAVEAMRTTRDIDGSVTAAAQEALRAALAAVSGRPLGGGAGGIAAAEFDGPGRRVATLGRDGKVMVWDLQAPDTPPRSIDPGSVAASAIRFSPDGNRLAIAGREPSFVAVLQLDAPGGGPLQLARPVEGLRVLDFSPDGHWLAAGGQDALLRLWRSDDLGAPPLTLTGHQPVPDYEGKPQGIEVLTFDQQGRWLLSAARDGLLLWDLHSPLAPPRQLHAGVLGAPAQFSPDGSWLALTAKGDTAAPQEGISLWRRQGEAWEPVALDSDDAAVTIAGVVGFLPGPPRLVTQGAGRVHIWDLAHKPLLARSFAGELAALAADGSRLAATWRSDRPGEPPHLLQLWDLPTPDATPIDVLALEAAPKQLAFSPSARHLSTVDEKGRLWLTTLDGPEPASVQLRGNEARTVRADFSADGRWLLAQPGWGADGARLWPVDNPSGDPVIVPWTRGSPSVSYERRSPGSSSSASGELFSGLPDAIAIDTESHWLAVPGDTGTALVVDLRDPTAPPRRLEGHSHDISAIAFAPNGDWLATADWHHAVRLWRMPDLGRPSVEFAMAPEDNMSSVPAIAVSRDGRYLATGSEAGTVALRDMHGNGTAPVRLLAGHDSWVTALRFSPDGKRLLSGGVDGTLRLWSVDEPAAEPRVLDAGGDAVGNAFFARGGGIVVGVTLDASIRLWPVENPSAPAEKLSGHAGRIVSSALDDGGRWLATGSDDGSVRLWDLHAPTQPSVAFGTPQAPITVVAISADAQWIAAADARRNIRLWQRAAPQGAPALLRPDWAAPGGTAGGAAPWALRFTPDGRWLVALVNGQAQLWRLRTDEQLQIACTTAGRNLSLELWETHLEGLPYRLSCPGHGLHPDYLAAVDRLAELGQVERATALYQRAAELDPALAFEPRHRAVELAIASHREEARRLALADQREGALAYLIRIAALAPELTLEPEYELERLISARELDREARRKAAIGAVEAAAELFRQARALDPARDVEPEKEARRLYAPQMEKAADALAEHGKIAEAVAEYERAIAWGLPSRSTPLERARDIRAHALVAEARDTGRSGDLDGAVRKLEQALALKPALSLDPGSEARKAFAEYRLDQAGQHARENRIAAAAAAYAEAFMLDPAARPWAAALNELCWTGATEGQAAAVLAVCEHAVRLDPENGGYRDSRGVARALTGDTAGAIADFRAFLDWAPAHGHEGEPTDARRRWISGLGDGARVRSFVELEALGAGPPGQAASGSPSSRRR